MYQAEVGFDSLELLGAWVSVHCQHPKGVKAWKGMLGNSSSFAKRDRFLLGLLLRTPFLKMASRDCKLSGGTTKNDHVWLRMLKLNL